MYLLYENPLTYNKGLLKANKMTKSEAQNFVTLSMVLFKYNVMNRLK